MVELLDKPGLIIVPGISKIITWFPFKNNACQEIKQSDLG